MGETTVVEPDDERNTRKKETMDKRLIIRERTGDKPTASIEKDKKHPKKSVADKKAEIARKAVTAAKKT